MKLVEFYDRLAVATSDDLLKAAEAVVDAALVCHSVECEVRLTEEARGSLIRAVYDDPTLTPHLFTR
ncbi:MAG: hypothetical protein IT292_07720 [Deltaproteobacteria bacterium]|nr:hypothetical protein [Deltaproteobacteria bacterium]